MVDAGLKKLHDQWHILNFCLRLINVFWDFVKGNNTIHLDTYVCSIGSNENNFVKSMINKTKYF